TTGRSSGEASTTEADCTSTPPAAGTTGLLRVKKPPAATPTRPPIGSHERFRTARRRASAPRRRAPRAVMRSARPEKSALATAASDAARIADPRPRIDCSTFCSCGSAARARSTVSRSAAVSSPSRYADSSWRWVGFSDMTTGPSVVGRKHPDSYSGDPPSVLLAFGRQGDAQRLRQQLLHLGPGMEEPGHDSSLRNFEDLCQLLVAEAIQFPEQEDGAVLLGDLLQGLLDLLPQLPLQGGFLRVAPQLARDGAEVGLGEV